MSPQLAALARQDGDKVVVLKVNIDRQPAMARSAGVRSIPDTRLYFAGQQLERRLGGMHVDEMRQLVQRHLGRLPAIEPRSSTSPASTRSPSVRSQSTVSVSSTARNVSSTQRQPASTPGSRALNRAVAVLAGGIAGGLLRWRDRSDE